MAVSWGPEFQAALRQGLASDTGAGSTQEILTNAIRTSIVTYLNEPAFQDMFGQMMTTIYSSNEFQEPIVKMVDYRAGTLISNIVNNPPVMDSISQAMTQQIATALSAAEATVTTMMKNAEDKITANFQIIETKAKDHDNMMIDLKAKSDQLQSL